MEELIKIEHMFKIYTMGDEEVRALDDVSLTVYKGDFLAIVGASGSGKSTLMNMLSCLDTPTSGTYTFNGTDVFKLNDNQLAHFRNKEVGCIFQRFNLLARMTALQNVIVPSQYSKMKVSERKERALMLLDKVGLKSRAHHKPSELSGGQQQRVAIARSLMCEPNIILCDEPTGALDSKSGHQVMDIIKGLNDIGKTIIMITHDMSLAREAKRIIEIHDGKIISDEINKDRIIRKPYVEEE